MARILDSDTLSELLAERNLTVAQHAAKHLTEFGNFTISAMTFYETQRGLVHTPKPKKTAVLNALLRNLVVLPTRMEEADLGGTLHGLLKRKGREIGDIDPLIAATAISYGLTLVTSNTNHYQRVIDLGFPLQLENWRTPSP